MGSPQPNGSTDHIAVGLSDPHTMLPDGCACSSFSLECTSMPLGAYRHTNSLCRADVSLDVPSIAAIGWQSTGKSLPVEENFLASHSRVPAGPGNILHQKTELHHPTYRCLRKYVLLQYIGLPFNQGMQPTLANQGAHRLAQEYDPSGDRTTGMLSGTL